MKGIPSLTRGIIPFLLLTLAACGGGSDSSQPPPPAQPPPPPVPGIVALSDVQPIFNDNCLANCHQPTGIGLDATGLDLIPGASYGGLYLQPATNLPSLQDTGLRVNPLDGSGSILLQRLNGDILPLMPLDRAPLSAGDIALVKRWIDDGASTTGQLHAVLSGAQVSAASGGPVAAAAAGRASLTLDSDRTTLSYTLDLGAVSDYSSAIQAVQIRVRDTGSLDGPVIFDCPLPLTLPATLSFSGTLTAADLQSQGDAVSFADAVSALLSGQTYLQVVTADHAGGETRGGIGLERFPTLALDGGQVLPTPVTTAAAGTGSVTINPDQDAISVSLDLGNATSYSSVLTAARIHLGASDATGPVLFDLPLPQPQPARPQVNVVLSAADLNPGQTDIASFPAAVDALLSGNTYLQIDTELNTGGEIRGQILP